MAFTPIPGSTPARPPWIPMSIYQWDGTQWWFVPLNASSAHMYWDAIVGGAIAGTGTSVAERAMFDSLLSREAFIQKLQSLNIILENGGAIQSQDYIPGLLGFLLNYLGDIELNHAIVRGHFVADSLEAGPLSLSRATPTTISRSFPAGTTGRAIRENIGASGIFNVVAGSSFGNTSINGIELVFRSWWGTDRNLWQSYEVYIHASGNRTLVAHTELQYPANLFGEIIGPPVVFQRIQLGAALSFTITMEGKTMRLLNLPAAPQIPTESGTVYRVNSNIPGSLGDYVLIVRA